MMFLDAEKCCKTTGVCETSQVPFSAELQKFFTLSRKCQTHFSYVEKYYHPRKFQFHERNLIKEFIIYTMFFKKCNEGTIMLNMDEAGVIENITEGIIQESKKYNCEVHFNVIWVFYYTYHDKEINSLPVFKIHKVGCNGAVFLDTFSKVYQTWNCYIDGPGLGESLLCVPRNGEYCFDGGNLNLEFVLTKSLCQHNDLLGCRSNSDSWVEHVAPLSQNLQNWAMEVKSWLFKHPEIHSTVKKFLNFFEENGKVIFEIAASILLAYLEPTLKINSQFAKLCLQASKIVFIPISTQKNLEFLSKFLIEIEKILAKNWKHYPEVKEFMVLLNKPSKNWVEISESLCCLINKIRHSW